MLASFPSRVLLSPVLLAQALQVRRRALQLPEAAGPRRGLAGAGPRLRLLIAGDSSAAGVGVDHQDLALAGQLVQALAADFTVEWQLEAQTGATTAQTLTRLQVLRAGPFDVAVTALGVNDVTRQVPLRRWLADQARIADLLAARFQVRAHWRSGLPPLARFPLLPRPLRDVLGAQARAFDGALAAASSDALKHLPFDETRLEPSMMARDGFHPGAAVYAAWGQDLAAAIRREFA
ncbi:SGNH/GDSL hydrolase family protein [Pararhodobacter sp.]|uniref:SGNH/GDSL hydrolase family protein n=1 Tax=Pararhodobacter sp. TaxID=2127056 RepID=UPI002AFFC5EF|nr:SGNH/GDSL hydrolase family protein [Pararhodobacter sp.]